jgi:Bacterial nucleoid DNA-binding protein
MLYLCNRKFNIYKNISTMPVFYKKTQRRNPMDPSAPKKWYCVLRRVIKAKTSDVAKAAASTTTASPKEVEMAMVRYFDTIVELLKNGRSVEIEGFGTFRMTANSKGADTKEELNSTFIIRSNARFIPSVELRQRLGRTQYVDVDELGKDTK